MIQGSPNESRGSFKFQEHPEGRKFEGIIYSFKNLGLKANNYGNAPKEKYMVRIESIDQMMDEDDDGVTRPFSVGIFVNKSWGDPSNRTGTRFPKMQRLREAVLDRDLKDEEWYDFDPNVELKGVRVKYKVRHTPRDDGGVWADAEIIERLEDQTVGVQFNEWVCQEEVPDVGQSVGVVSAPKPVETLGGSPNRIAFASGLATLKNAGALGGDEFDQWDEWLETAASGELYEQYDQFVKLAAENSVEIAEVQLPF